MKQILKKSAIFSLAAGIFFCPITVGAREDVTDWYIQNFDSEIIVNKDSSLDITEKITADCGDAEGKHGIFRVLPEDAKLDGGKTMKSPVELVSITDFNDKPLKYSTSEDTIDHTITWKIGDPNKTVQGVNYYKIHYTVQNAIRFNKNPGNDEFAWSDELYWNLNGNFWELETDHFHAKIIFPSDVDRKKDGAEVFYYTGQVGEKRTDLASYEWTAPNILKFNSTKTLKSGDGITASITFQNHIFTPYIPGFWETYGRYFFFIIPLIVFGYCFRAWWKFGKDPKIDKTVIAEYEIPQNLTPIETGMLMENASFDNSFVTAEIINLASMGLLTIKEKTDKILLFNLKNYVLTRKHDAEKEKNLIDPQKKILEKIFEDGDEVELSDLKNSFYTVLDKIEESTKKILENKKFIATSGKIYESVFMIAGILLAFISFFTVIISSVSGYENLAYLSGSALMCGIIMIIFGAIMPKRTIDGAETVWKIKGFKLFMETVDKDRAKFYEKENIFEKCLPYAIVFGMTKEWIRRIKDIYGEDYFSRHVPAWYVGTNIATFDVDNFMSAVETISTDIATRPSSSSGSGGGGFSGGGGGGGGGGGW